NGLLAGWLVWPQGAAPPLWVCCRGTLKYELPSREVSLSKVFKVMAEAKQALQVVDWGVANATLEEVFIKLAKGAGAQTKD
ncbi:hypothetical protein QJQ45_030495, partial [Haematococcus lacustris]